MQCNVRLSVSLPRQFHLLTPVRNVPIARGINYYYYLVAVMVCDSVCTKTRTDIVDDQVDSGAEVPGPRSTSSSEPPPQTLVTSVADGRTTPNRAPSTSPDCSRRPVTQLLACLSLFFAVHVQNLDRPQ